MGSVNLQKFYPDNGEVKSTEINANFNAVAGSSQGINDDNVATEGLIRDNFANHHSVSSNNKGMSIKHANFQENGYYKSTGTAVTADAKYHSLTDVSSSGSNKTIDANKRQEINHNNIGVTATSQGVGTKIPVGGLSGSSTNANGVALEVGDIIHVFWNVTAWRFEPDSSTLTNYVCELIDASSTRSTILNYAMCVWPEFNTQDAGGSNSNFEPPDDGSHGFATASPGFAQPNDGVAPLGGGGGSSDPNSTGLNNLMPFADKRRDHWTWIPVMMGSGGATNGANDDTVAVMMDAENGPGNNAVGGAKNCAGQTYTKVDTAKTLYSIQLYITGLMGLHYNTTTTKNGTFIEDQAVTNAQGGIDGQLHIERASIGYVIYRKEGV